MHNALWAKKHNFIKLITETQEAFSDNSDYALNKLISFQDSYRKNDYKSAILQAEEAQKLIQNAIYAIKSLQILNL